jgi:hypothetical protein
VSGMRLFIFLLFIPFLLFSNQLEVLSKVDGYLAKGYIHEYDNEPELAEKYYKKAVRLVVLSIVLKNWRTFMSQIINQKKPLKLLRHLSKNTIEMLCIIN